MKFFQKFWGANDNNPKISEESQKQPKPKDETYIDIIISLNKNYQIDFSLFLDDKVDSLPMSMVDYSVLCSEFLDSVVSSKMKNDAVDILNSQIKTESNETLINNIVSLLKILDKSSYNKKGKQFIRPSEVFSKYVV
jgi:hypothetical protein